MLSDSSRAATKSFLDFTLQFFRRPDSPPPPPPSSLPPIPMISLSPAPVGEEFSPEELEEWDRISDEMLSAVREVRRRRGALTERCPLMASSSITTYWSQVAAANSGTALPSDAARSDLWTSIRPGMREIWSSLTYALASGSGGGRRKHVKIYVLETSSEYRRRFVGPTFRTPQEAHHFAIRGSSAWPGDRGPLDLRAVRAEGLLKAWSRVWSAEVEACVRTSAESAERFVENFNITTGSTLHVRVPKTFVDQLMTQFHKETIDHPNPCYPTMGRGYFFPDQPADEESDGTDMPDTPIANRVYAFAPITVSAPDHESRKYGFVRSRVKCDQYFVACTPDFHYDEMEELKTYHAEDTDPYPKFDFDAKWMLLEILRTLPENSDRELSYGAF